MPNEFRLLMLGAMYENGGNTVHRLLDGHPGLYTYPFESQLGTRHVIDQYTSTMPSKYRWPEFVLDSSPAQDYAAIIDEECKVRALTPRVSKFRDYPFDFEDAKRRELFEGHVAKLGRGRANNVAAFFRATFEAWNDHRSSGEERVYVGYSPVLGVDAEKILSDFPDGHFLHIVRNPWSAYADTKKRPVPLSLSAYMNLWTLSQYFALLALEKHPGRMHVLRLEDVLPDPHSALSPICQALGLAADESLRSVSWNGTPMTEVYPWGTIRTPTPEANRATAAELDAAEREAVRWRAQGYLERLGYQNFPD